MTQATTRQTMQWLLCRAKLPDAIKIAKRTAMMSRGRFARHWSIVYIKLKLYAIYSNRFCK